MSEKQYYRRLLLAVQDKIHGLGSTNRNRWAAFCYNKTMSYDEFVDKMNVYNIQYQGNDLRVIWDSVGIQSDTMNFQDFLKVMQADVDEFEPVKSNRMQSRGPSSNDFYADQPTPSYGQRQSPQYGAPARGGFSSGGNCNDTIHENLRDIVIACMSRDSLMTGEISRNGFADVCSQYGIRESAPGFSRLLSIGDATGSGLIQYFTIAAHICSTSSAGSAFDAPPARGGFDQPAFDDPPRRGGFDQSAFDEPPRRGGFDQSAFDEPPRRGGFEQPTFDEHPQQRRTAYESSISFGADEPPARSGFGETPVQRRTAYESSISFGADEPPAHSGFGETPVQRRTAYESSISFGGDEPRQNFQRNSSGGYGSGGYGSGGSGGAGFDEFANCERGSNDVNEVLKNISVKVTENIGNSKQTYQRWRGMSDRLGSEQIRQGLIRDCHYNVPINVIQEICSRYGDPMNLTGFVRMMGDGTTIAEETPRRSGGGTGRMSATGERAMTEDDRTIEDIALQLRGKDWENAVERANNADELCRVFSRLGCRVDVNRVRVLVSKQGRNGFLDSISDYIGN